MESADPFQLQRQRNRSLIQKPSPLTFSKKEFRRLASYELPATTATSTQSILLTDLHMLNMVIIRDFDKLKQK